VGYDDEGTGLGYGDGIEVGRYDGNLVVGVNVGRGVGAEGCEVDGKLDG